MRCTKRSMLGLGAVLFVVACDREESAVAPPAALPLQVSSVLPAVDAVDVETGASIAVTFNQDIDPTTLSAATFVIRRDALPLPVALRYDADSRTATAVAPLLPGVQYQVEVTTGVRAAGGDTLAAGRSWSFTTRAWQSVAVDEPGQVGAYSTLSVDWSGRLHVAYYDQDHRDLKYAWCYSVNAPAGQWDQVAADSGGDVGIWNSLAVDGSGRAHVTYLDLTTRDLKYATCASGCGLASRWHSASVDTTGQVGLQSSVAVEGGGRVHATYRDVSNGSLKYATCAGDCASAANWRFAIVGAGSGTIEANGAKAPSAEGAWSSLAVDADGRLHVAYQEFASDDLRYATCLGDCADGANWQRLTVSSFGNVGEHASLAVGPDGRLHVMYFDGTDGALEYATCPGDCTVAANWSVRTVDSSAPLTGPWASLEVDANGRLHVSYYDGTNRDLKYATCATGCGTLENWQIITADSAGDVGKYSSLAIDSGGRIHISYLDDATDDLRYLW